MKKLLLILLFFAGCKKDSASDVQVLVKDAVTNTPVKGVEVGIHRCTIYTNTLCGLIAYRSAITGDNGSCSFNKDDYAQAMTIKTSKSDYWEIFEPVSNSLRIYPEGWMQLRIIRGANYPPKSKLNITMTNLLTGSNSSTHYFQYNTTVDSSVLMRGYGGLSNKIDWSVVDSLSKELNTGTWFQLIPRLGTVNVTLNY